jgi:RNA polymerase sigma-70 factor (ECF subfamily)
MPRKGERVGDAAELRPVVYCLVPRDLAARLHEPLRRHFRGDPAVEVIIEQRGSERRAVDERRTGAPRSDAAPDRRRIRSVGGRRVAERRAVLAPSALPTLPYRVRQYAQRLTFIERLEPSRQQREDENTARIVGQIQAGDAEQFAVLYMRYFDRVYGYVCMALGDPAEAENAVQEVFMKILEALPRYQLGGAPFRAWLFVIVRNQTISELRRRGRLDLVAPAELERRPSRTPEVEQSLDGLDWVSNQDLLLFIERLPPSQKQALYLRYALDLSHKQMAEIMQRRPDDVRALLSRAHRFLRQRLLIVASRGETRSQMVFCRPQSFILRRRRFALMR